MGQTTATMDSYSPYTNAKLTSLDPNHLAPTVAVRDPTPERRRTALIACVAVACMVGSFCVGHTVATQSLVGSTSEATTAPKFAPNTRFNPPTRTTLNAARGLTEPNFGNDGEFDILSQPGIIEPTGFFDPLKLTKGKSEARLKYFCEAEIKHGRVAMLAALGFLVGESFHPLFGGNIDSPSYLAFQQTPLETFWPGVLGHPHLQEPQGSHVDAPRRLHQWRSRFRPSRHQAQGPRGSRGDADQGDPERSSCDAGNRRHGGAGAGRRQPSLGCPPSPGCRDRSDRPGHVGPPQYVNAACGIPPPGVILCLHNTRPCRMTSWCSTNSAAHMPRNRARAVNQYKTDSR